MNRFLKNALSAAIGGLALVTTASYAVPVSNAFAPGAVNEFSDDNAEIFIDNNGNGLIDIGDYIIGVIGFTSFGPTGGSAQNFNQLSGIYGVEVLTADGVPGGVCGSAAFTTCTTYTFGAISTGLVNTVNTLFGLGITDPVDDGTTIALLYEHDAHPGGAGTLPTPVVTPPGTVGEMFELAVNGTQRLTIGLVDANGDSFSGNAPASLAEFGLVDQGVGVGSIAVNLTVTQQNFPGWNLGPDITGRGTISAPADGPFPIGSDTTFFTRIQRVPEPGTVSLLGLAMLALGFFTRRRSS